MSRLKLAVEQIQFARTYTLRFVEQTNMADWFRVPATGMVTHIAWQVGHMAFAQYRLALERTRGPRPEDKDLISDRYVSLFGRDTKPSADAALYPSAEEIRDVFDRVHQQVLAEVPLLDESELDKPVVTPHLYVKTKYWALIWCAQHEAIHTGQIGLLRRQLGQPPLW